MYRPYLISLIYQHGPKKGSTETFYRIATSAREASDFGGAAGLRPFMDFRPTSTVLQAIRAQEETGLKRVFLRLCWIHGRKNAPPPDNPGIAAKIQIPVAGGGHRALELRGLLDAHVARGPLGHDRPGPGFLSAVAALSERMRELRLCARSLRRQHAKQEVLWYGLHPDAPHLTLIELRNPDFLPAVGSYVDFGGGGLRWLSRSRGYLVMDSRPGYLTIYFDWQNIRDQRTMDARLLGAGKVWCRQLEYDYDRLGDLEFAGFGTYPTGPRYRPASWAVENPWRSPLSPCGRIVDFLRQPYTVEMAHWRGEVGATVKVRWYYPEIIPLPELGQPTSIEEIPSVPWEHPFASRQWERGGDFLPSLGERLQYARNNGRPIALLRGIGLCGSRDAWENGAGPHEPTRPINETTGQPCCCGPGALLVAGGGAGGGPVLTTHQVGGGGAGGGQLHQLHQVGGGGAGGGQLHQLHQVGGGGAGGGLVEIVHQVRGGGASGRYLPPAGVKDSCSSAFPLLPFVYLVTITGATGTAAFLNGVKRTDYLGGCIWVNDIEDYPDYEVFLSVYDNGGPELQIIIFDDVGGGDAEYYLNPMPSATGPMIATKTSGAGKFPPTVSVSGSLIRTDALRGGGAGGGAVVVLVPPGNELLIDLAGYWPLGEASGGEPDAHGSNGLSEIGVIGAAAGILAGARNFEAGDTVYFEHATNAVLEVADIDFTVQAWVKLESDPGNMVIASKWGGGGWILYTSGSKFFFNLAGQGLGALTFGPISTDVWYHVLAEHDSVNNEIRISVNGVMDYLSWAGGTNATSSPFRIGQASDTYWWDGLICEVGFWKRILTSDEKTLLNGGGAGLPYSAFGAG